jgi:hypothetical protein
MGQTGRPNVRLFWLLWAPVALAQTKGTTNTTGNSTSSWSWSSVPSPPPWANSQASYGYWAAAIHDHLLGNAAGYSKSTVPTSNRVDNHSQAGADVSTQIRFFKVDEVETAKGILRMKVWLRMTWPDLRLSWDPSQFGGVTEIKAHASSFADPETTEYAPAVARSGLRLGSCAAAEQARTSRVCVLSIWVPDITAYNARQGLMHVCDAAMARIYSDGTVYWARACLLDVMCRFSGLIMFPFDTLSCPIEVGGWQTSGTYQGIVPYYNGCADTVKGNEEVRDASALVTLSATCGGRRGSSAAAKAHVAHAWLRRPSLRRTATNRTDGRTHARTLARSLALTCHLMSWRSPARQVAMASYTEYEINRVTCQVDQYMYDDTPGQVWPVLKYRVYLDRSYQYYMFFAIVPSIILTFAGFSVFFMSFQVRRPPPKPTARRPPRPRHRRERVLTLARFASAALLPPAGRRAPRCRRHTRAHERGDQGDALSDDPCVRGAALARDLQPAQLSLHDGRALRVHVRARRPVCASARASRLHQGC